MTDITPEALEALSKKAEQTEDDIRYYSGGSKYNEPLEQLKDRLVHLYRTGQLIHVVPSDYLTRAHAQIASGQSKENTELDSALIAQPSGDVVEAVARAIYEEDDPWCKAWPWPNLQPDQAGADAYRRIATAAITTYEAVSGVAKMRDALKKTMTALAEAIEEERARINSMRGAVLERTTNRDLAAIAEWQSAVDAARAALRAQEAGDV